MEACCSRATCLILKCKVTFCKMGEDFHISFEGPEPRPDEDARYRTLEQSVDSIPAEFLDPKELLRIAHAWMDEQYEESRRLQEPFRMRLHQILQDIEALGDRELSESEEDDERNGRHQRVPREG